MSVIIFQQLVLRPLGGKRPVKGIFSKFSKKLIVGEIENLATYNVMLKKSSHSPRHFTFEDWQNIIKDWKETSVTVPQSCKQNNLSKSTFRRWLKKNSDSKFSSQPNENLRTLPMVVSSQAKENTSIRVSDIKETNSRFAFEKWKKIIEDWQKSGLSRYEYSRRNNIPNSTLYIPLTNETALLMKGKNEISVVI